MESNKPQGDKEEKKGLIYAFENFSFKKAFRYNLLILVIFLFIIGILSVFVLSDEAYRLVGGNRYNELVRDSGKNIKFSVFEKIKYLFSDEATKEKMIAEKLGGKGIDKEGDFDKEKDVLEGKSGVGGEDGIYNGGDRGYLAGGVGMPYKPKGSMNASLNSPNTYLSGGASNTSASISSSESGVSSVSRFKGVGSGVAKIKNIDAKYSFSKPVGKNSNSALDMLKSTYKTTLYAARDASNDTARHWTAKAFEGASDIKSSLEYNEKLKSKLDRINPNAIPAFLKDSSLDSEEMKSLKEASVPGFSKDDEETEKLKDEMKNEMSDMVKNAMKDAAKSALNPMFNFGENRIIDQNEEKNLGEGVSSSELIEVKTNDMIKYYDKDGKLLGCEIPAIGVCALPNTTFPKNPIEREFLAMSSNTLSNTALFMNNIQYYNCE
jgi:hypothetical protein